MQVAQVLIIIFTFENIYCFIRLSDSFNVLAYPNNVNNSCHFIFLLFLKVLVSIARRLKRREYSWSRKNL